MALGACSTTAESSAPSDRRFLAPEPSSGPYVVVAVDNHFHDIHPIDDPKIAAHRPFVVRNEGRNLHNFTVIGTDISVNLRPGDVLRWRHLGDHLRPGNYRVVCKFHYYVNMRGRFTVTR